MDGEVLTLNWPLNALAKYSDLQRTARWTLKLVLPHVMIASLNSPLTSKLAKGFVSF